MKEKYTAILMYYSFIFLVGACTYLYLEKASIITKYDHKINNYRLLLSISQPDSIVINCVRCNWRNVRYGIDTTNHK